MNSPQEQIVSLFSQRSMGAPFIFEPDDYDKGAKGNQRREPPDMAWVANGCAVLFWMMERKPSKESRKPTAYLKAVEHNLGQAAGWMRVWRDDRKLIGANADRRFSIGRDEVRHVVVISVVDAPEVPLQYHEDHARKLGVTRCATISQTALHMLANMAASMLDVLIVIDLLRVKGDIAPLNVISEIGAIEHMAWTLAVNGFGDITAAKPAFEEAAQIIRRLRLPEPGQIKAGPQTSDPWLFAEYFNDMTLAEHLQLVLACAAGMHRVRRRAVEYNGTLQYVQRLIFGRLEVVVRVATDLASLTKSLALGKTQGEKAKGAAGVLEVGLAGWPISRETVHEMPFMSIVSFLGRPGPSRTQELLARP